MTDAELNALFATHVAGYHREPSMEFDSDDWHDSNGVYVCSVDGFDPVHDASAVLPWLEKHSVLATYQRQSTPPAWQVIVTTGYPAFEATADTFPRACVLALLRAKGVDV